MKPGADAPHTFQVETSWPSPLATCGPGSDGRPPHVPTRCGRSVWKVAGIHHWLPVGQVLSTDRLTFLHDVVAAPAPTFRMETSWPPTNEAIIAKSTRASGQLSFLSCRHVPSRIRKAFPNKAGLKHLDAEVLLLPGDFIPNGRVDLGSAL